MMGRTSRGQSPVGGYRPTDILLGLLPSGGSLHEHAGLGPSRASELARQPSQLRQAGGLAQGGRRQAERLQRARRTRDVDARADRSGEELRLHQREQRFELGAPGSRGLLRALEPGVERQSRELQPRALELEAQLLEPRRLRGREVPALSVRAGCGNGW